VESLAGILWTRWPASLEYASAGDIQNTKSQYNMLSKLVKWMRVDNRMSWEVLEDRTRRMTDKRGWESIDLFLEDNLQWFLNGYERCLVQGQDKYIEVWTEKDALIRIFEDVVYPYCMRAVVCRGYQSVTFISNFCERAQEAIMRGQKPVVLYFGDLDPSGIQMLEATIETLENEMDLEGVEFKRIALNPEQVTKYNLPHDPTAAKKKDTRYKRYVRTYGTIAVELDALHPAQLTALIRSSIEAEIDGELFQEQRHQERVDRAQVTQLREKVMKVVHEEIGRLTSQT